MQLYSVCARMCRSQAGESFQLVSWIGHRGMLEWDTVARACGGELMYCTGRQMAQMRVVLRESCLYMA